jgi:hypothetical protein
MQSTVVIAHRSNQRPVQAEYKMKIKEVHFPYASKADAQSFVLIGTLNYRINSHSRKVIRIGVAEERQKCSHKEKKWYHTE